MYIFGSGIRQATERVAHAVNIAMKEIDNKKEKRFSPRKLLESSILVQIWDWLTSKSANPSGHPTDPSQMAITMEMSASANQITGFNTRIRQDSCVRPLSVTKINFAEALPQH